MENLEKVEKIREKTGVSYEDAKNALEACNYDILDAIIYLENLGKITPQSQAIYSTQQQVISSQFANAQKTYENDTNKQTVGSTIDKFISWCGKVLKKSVENTFVVEHAGKKAGEFPVLVLVLLIIFAFWVVIPLMVIGLFFDFRYHFNGVSKVTVDLNEACDKMADAANNVKNDNKQE